MVYLDNAATTKPLLEVIETITKVMEESYGNPSSLHKKGIEAEDIIKEASDFFASQLGCTRSEIVYTSGGTESNNLAILGVAYAYKRYGTKIITTMTEHSSVGEVFSHLETQGFEICRLKVDKNGNIDIQELKNEINDNTILVSAMHVNNEVGTINDVSLIGNTIKSLNKDTIFHVDGVQSFTKVSISVKTSKIDLLSISGHKFYGPKGVGLLYKNSKVRLANIFHGGGQQNNVRSGTENVYGIAGMYVAAKICMQNKNEYTEHYKKCKQYLADGILDKISNVQINGPAVEEGAPHILSVHFEGVKAEVLLHALENNDIFVSSGSACSSKKHENILSALGMTNTDNTIRFSFNKDITIEQLDYVIDTLVKQVELLRKFTSGGRR